MSMSLLALYTPAVTKKLSTGAMDCACDRAGTHTSAAAADTARTDDLTFMIPLLGMSTLASDTSGTFPMLQMNATLGSTTIQFPLYAGHGRRTNKTKWVIR